MNINQRIAELDSKGGLPRYNRKINELVEIINWLMGMQTSNGKIVSENSRGPVLSTGGVAAPTPTGDQPWLTAPDSTAAQWTQVTVIDVPNGQVYDLWSWTGQTHINPRFEVWLKDPDGVAAQWVQHDVCVSGSVVSKWFWGTP